MADLGGQEDLAARDAARPDRRADAALGAVFLRRVDVAVSRFQCLGHDRRAVRRQIAGTEADHRHARAVRGNDGDRWAHDMLLASGFAALSQVTRRLWKTRNDRPETRPPHGRAAARPSQKGGGLEGSALQRGTGLAPFARAARKSCGRCGLPRLRAFRSARMPTCPDSASPQPIFISRPFFTAGRASTAPSQRATLGRSSATRGRRTAAAA